MTIPGPGRLFAPSTLMACFFAASMFVNGIVLPYLPVLLVDRGLSGEEIALVLALPFLGRLVSIPVVTRLADWSSDRRRPLIGVAALTLVAATALGAVTDRWTVMALATAMLVINAAMGPLGDAIAMGMDRRGRGDYGRMRLWGSVTFIVGNLLGGAALGHAGVSSIYVLMVGGYSLALFATMIIPAAEPIPVRTDAQPGNMLRRPAFLAVLTAGALIQASHAALFGFATLSWQARGFADSLIGAFWAIGVIAEILLFAFARRLPHRIPPTALILIGGVIGLVRWMLFPVDMPAVPTALLQAGHAGSFALAHLGMMRFISETVPEERSASAQGAYVILIGVAMAASTVIAGRLWTLAGDGAFLSMAGFCAVGVGILLVGPPGARRVPLAPTA